MNEDYVLSTIRRLGPLDPDAWADGSETPVRIRKEARPEDPPPEHSGDRVDALVDRFRNHQEA